MNKKLYLGVAVLGLVITTGVVAGISEASQGGWLSKSADAKVAIRESGDFKSFGEYRKTCQNSEEGTCPFAKKNNQLHKNINKMPTEARAALETGTYEEWLAIAGADCKIAEKVNSENFAQFQEMHKLKTEGNFEEVKVIAEELGMNEFAQKKNMKRFEQRGGCSKCPNKK